MKKTEDANLVWYARGSNIAKMGPYSSQVKAWASLMKPNGLPIEGATVWCEEKE